jgi:hypothetical protein
MVKMASPGFLGRLGRKETPVQLAQLGLKVHKVRLAWTVWMAKTVNPVCLAQLGRLAAPAPPEPQVFKARKDQSGSKAPKANQVSMAFLDHKARLEILELPARQARKDRKVQVD